MVMAKVLVPNVKGKSLIQVEDTIYIVQAMGYYTNQEIQYDISTGVKVPSLLYGLALLYENDLDDAVKFIKENW